MKETFLITILLACLSGFGHASDCGSIDIYDGIAAPSAVAGRARIYVDSSSGDLKVIFGDGTIKTITTDT